MGVLPDWMIQEANIITPFEPQAERLGVISYGCSSYGYDIRVGHRFKVFTNAHCSVMDPKAVDQRAFVEVDLTPKEHRWVKNHAAKTNNREPIMVCELCEMPWRKNAENCLCSDNLQPDDHILIPPNSYVLAESLETFNVPRDVIGMCVGKSTLARVGLIVNLTPLEPGWKGKLTIEISNSAPIPCKLYAGEGVAQVLFFKGEAECKVSYADKKGKYQGQGGMQTSIVR
jgi:dCTP deaminase